MELTSEQRISIIKHAVRDSKSVGLNKPLEDFISEIKSQEVLGEHGLLDAQQHDIEDEMSLIDYDPTAESIDEEDQDFGISSEMKGVSND
tara:strand:+ start:156 stop:425 length:270 start_codon:yes stop_codon:yes gene_type:complete